MKFLLENDLGQFYAGFDDGRPVWFKARREETQLDEHIADTVLRQLTQLGFTGISKKLYLVDKPVKKIMAAPAVPDPD